MNAEELLDRLAAERCESGNDWSTMSDQARADWGSEPQVSAVLDYLDGLSDSDRDSALTGSTYETLKSWIRSGVFVDDASADHSDEDDGAESWQEPAGQEAPTTAEMGESSTVLAAFAELTEQEFAQLISDGFVSVEEVAV